MKILYMYSIWNDAFRKAGLHYVYLKIAGVCNVVLYLRMHYRPFWMEVKTADIGHLSRTVVVWWLSVESIRVESSQSIRWISRRYFQWMMHYLHLHLHFVVHSFLQIKHFLITIERTSAAIVQVSVQAQAQAQAGIGVRI